MLGISQKGSNFSRTYKFLDKAMNPYYNFVNRAKINEILQQGINDLKQATPKSTGLTASSWSYEMQWVPILGWWKIIFSNSNIQDGVPIAVILDTGHATKNGGWIEGEHYIDPTIRPIFERIIKSMWEEIIKPLHSKGITW